MTAAPWEISWFVCVANSEDVKFAKTEGRNIKVGDELWRVPQAIGPLATDHNHWAGEHFDCTPEEAQLAAHAPVMLGVLKDILELEADEDGDIILFADEHRRNSWRDRIEKLLKAVQS